MSHPSSARAEPHSVRAEPVEAPGSVRAEPVEAHHDSHHDELGYHASVKGYVIGFVLSVILTAIPFWLVMAKVIPSPKVTAFVILAFAAVQMVVHMVYFLHMDAKAEGGWSLLALGFTVILVVILLAGSIWVMYHLNTNMMPPDAHTLRNMP